jgi:cyclophilin family peptidyl-prolyl cis-trans isomerase
MMRIKKFFVLSLSLSVAVAVTAQVKKPAAKPIAKSAAPAAKPAAGSRVKITTSMGVIIVRLYNETPQHRDNFLKLANQHFFDSLLFQRVIKGFMVQGGDPLSKNAEAGAQLGMGGGDMSRIPAEFNPALIHKKGTLAAARDGNPEKASSACQFYLVQGGIMTDAQLNQQECSIRGTMPEFSYTEEQRKIYKTVGGTPFLDMNYTVFGEIEKGLDVVDKIAATATAPGDRPLTDIRMKIEVIK